MSVKVAGAESNSLLSRWVFQSNEEPHLCTNNKYTRSNFKEHSIEILLSSLLIKSLFSNMQTELIMYFQHTGNINNLKIRSMNQME